MPKRFIFSFIASITAMLLVFFAEAFFGIGERLLEISGQARPEFGFPDAFFNYLDGVDLSIKIGIFSGITVFLVTFFPPSIVKTRFYGRVDSDNTDSRKDLETFE